MKNKILKNIFSLYSVQGINYLIPLIMTPYLLRTFGLKEFGVYTIVLAIIQYVVIFADYGFNLTATKQISLNIDNKREISLVFFSVIACKILIAISCFLVIVILSQFLSINIHIDYILLGAGIAVGASFYPVWLFQGYEKMHWIAIFNAISKIINLLLVFLLVNSKNDIGVAIIVQSIVGTGTAIIACTKAIINKYVVLVLPTINDIKYQLSTGRDIFVSTVFVSLYTTSIPLILGYNCGPESSGIYNAADKIRQALQGLIGPISQAIYPRANQLMKKSKLEGICFVFNISKYIVTAVFFGCFIVFYNSELIVHLIYGANNVKITHVLNVIVFIPPLVVIANMIGIQIMLPLGMVKEFRNAYLYAGILGLPCMYYGAYYFNYIGVSYIALLVELLILLQFVLSFKRENIYDLCIHLYSNKK